MEPWRPVLPPLATTAWLGPALLVLVLATARLVAWLKRARGWRTGDTRKVFHFAIFSTAAALSAAGGVAAVNLLGGIAGLVVLHALLRGDGHPVFEALAREQDEPRRALHVLLPFLATAAGGVTSSALFGPWATVGYAVAGWGDAVGEPVGLRYGRHRYRVPTIGGVACTRSLEGSASVLVASALAAWIALGVLDAGPATPLARAGVAVAVAVAATAVEAASPHGTDNFTLQVAASASAWALVGTS